jgi:hypothetical protein
MTNLRKGIMTTQEEQLLEKVALDLASKYIIKK